MWNFRGLLSGILRYARTPIAAKEDDIAVMNQDLDEHVQDLKAQGLGAYKYLQLPFREDRCQFTTALDDGPFIDALRWEAGRCNLVLQPFITTEPALALVRSVPGMTLAASRLNLVEEMNDKAGAWELFKDLHIERSPGAICASQNDIERAARDLKGKGVRNVVLKDPSPYIASGKSKLGEMRVDGNDQQFALGLLSLKSSYQQFRGKKRVILEQWWEAVETSPSIVGNITAEGKTELIAMTEQLMEPDDKTEYRGSVIPAGSHKVDPEDLPDMFRIYQLVANKLVKRGWIGVFGIDFIIVRHQGKRLVIPTEINGRYTGSMYLVNIMRRLGIEDWVGFSSNIRLPLNTSYSCLRTAIELVEDRNKARIIPLNVGPLAYGKATIAVLIRPHVAHAVAYAEGVCKEIRDILSVPRSRQYYELSA